MKYDPNARNRLDRVNREKQNRIRKVSKLPDTAEYGEAVAFEGCLWIYFDGKWEKYGAGAALEALQAEVDEILTAPSVPVSDEPAWISDPPSIDVYTGMEATVSFRGDFQVGSTPASFRPEIAANSDGTGDVPVNLEDLTLTISGLNLIVDASEVAYGDTAYYRIIANIGGTMPDRASGWVQLVIRNRVQPSFGSLDALTVYEGQTIIYDFTNEFTEGMPASTSIAVTLARNTSGGDITDTALDTELTASVSGTVLTLDASSVVLNADEDNRTVYYRLTATTPDLTQVHSTWVTVTIKNAFAAAVDDPPVQTMYEGDTRLVDWSGLIDDGQPMINGMRIEFARNVDGEAITDAALDTELAGSADFNGQTATIDASGVDVGMDTTVYYRLVAEQDDPPT